MKKDFISITDLSAEEIIKILTLAGELKAELKEKGFNRHLLMGKTMVMIFEKPSLRTRLSFEVGMNQLGGHAVYITGKEVGIGERESVSDVARVASSMGDVLMARTYKHDTLVELAKYAPIPVINGLSEWEHPCQILADLLTIKEEKGKLAGLKLAYIGDGENNVAHSLALVAGLLGMNLSVASPPGYWLNEKVASIARKISDAKRCTMYQTTKPKEAVEGADVVYTDTWISMGDEKEEEKRLKVFPPYKITAGLMSCAKSDAIFMHDLPADRGSEVESEVIDGLQSVIFKQAENRLHAQKGLIIYLMKEYENKKNAN